MEKLNNNELLACMGGKILTSFTGLFISFISVVRKVKFVFGGRR